MSATRTDNGKDVLDRPVASTGTSVDRRLDAIETELHEQSKTVRNAQRGWSIFALFALLIAGANLIVIAAKLDSKSSKTTAASAPAAAAPANAAATATPGKVGV